MKLEDIKTLSNRKGCWTQDTYVNGEDVRDLEVEEIVSLVTQMLEEQEKKQIAYKDHVRLGLFEVIRDYLIEEGRLTTSKEDMWDCDTCGDFNSSEEYEKV